MSKTFSAGSGTSGREQAEERDLYQLLRVSPLASREIIAEAYWVLVRKEQAARIRDQTASEALHHLNAAYATLINADLRLSYNLTLPPQRRDGGESVPGVIRRGRRPLRLRLLGRRARSGGPNGQNLYRILQVDPHAEREIIAAAYGCLRQQYREGIWNGRGSQESLDELTEAFSVLADGEQRAAYDATLGLRQQEEVIAEPAPPPVADEPRTPASESKDEPSAVSHTGIKIAALAAAVDWSGLWRKLGRFLGRLLVAAGRAARFAGRHLYRGTRWLAIVVVAPAVRSLATAGNNYVHALLKERERRWPAPPSDEVDQVVRERLSAKSIPSIRTLPRPATGETASQPTAAIARLIICGGPHSGSTFIVTDRPVSLGADPQCDVILESQGDNVAPLHARIWYREGRFMIHQIADREKVQVGGRPLAWGVLEDGDELRIGHHQLTFEEIPSDGDVLAGSSGDDGHSSDDMDQRKRPSSGSDIHGNSS